MNQVLTVDEINQQFDSEWVLLDDVQSDSANQVLSGRVVIHSKDRDEVYRKLLELPKPRRFAIFYTGKLPKDAAIVL